MNKKAQLSGYELKWALMTLLFIVLAAGALMILLARYMSFTADSFSLEANLLANRIIYSQSGLAFVDETTGRVYPGIIDAAKLDDSQLEQRLMKAVDYGQGQSYLTAKFTIAGKIFYYNNLEGNDWYNRTKPRAGLRGGPKSITLEKYVLVKSGELLTPQTVEIEILQSGEPA